jgi:branched-chain amino acid transport system ATP-binding protein
MLKVEQLSAHYGGIHALQGIELEVPDRTIVSLIGANGAGKSTTMRALSGLLRPVRGTIRFDGRDISRLPADRIVRMGLALVPEGRKVFAPLSVRENLEMGGFQHLFPRTKAVFAKHMAFVLDLFPRLEERLEQPAGTLSGGEQQMLAIGRALMSGPRLLLLDEPSMGLAPLIVTQIFNTLKRLNELGTTLFVCEQNTAVTLRKAQQAYVLEGGRITLSGTAASLAADDRVREAYLGL